VAAELALVLEQEIVHLPEPALLARRQRGLGRRQRMVVEPEWHVLPHHAHAGPVGFGDLRERIFQTRAEGALKIGPDDDRALGGRGPTDRGSTYFGSIGRIGLG